MRNIALSMALLASNGLLMHAPDANAATSNCHLPDGWSQVEQRQPRYVIFGELHGSVQSPSFVANVACALASSGKSVLVGVELHAINDPQFQDAWGKPHDQFADVLRKAGWAGRQDGVASEAMFSMLVNLHALKDKGARIAIVAFSGSKNAEQARKFATLPGQGPHDAAMAENIAEASRAQAYDLTLVLVGNIHARLQPVSFAGSSFQPMAMKLAETGPLVSLDMKSTGGTAWNCQLRDGFKPEAGKPVRNEDVACASRPVSSDPDPQPDQSIVVKRTADGTYDGAFWLGHIDGSPPAVPAG
jgi:hypothetical protein